MMVPVSPSVVLMLLFFSLTAWGESHMLDYKCPEPSMDPTSVRLCAPRGNPSLQDKHSCFSHTNCIPSVFPTSTSKKVAKCDRPLPSQSFCSSGN